MVPHFPQKAKRNVAIAIQARMADPFHLQRFLDAQAPIYPQVLRELRAGEKQSHWMWFIFPQIRGLGSSPTAVRYAISSLDEARAYLAHEVLGPRLRECTTLVNAVKGRSVSSIFGYPDDLKFHSSMTLFAKASNDTDDEFATALRTYFSNTPDSGTLQHL